MDFKESDGLVEVAVGSVAQRGKVIPLNMIQGLIRPETELYRSMFVLDQSAEECFKRNGTIRSYDGKYALDKITFDIDVGSKRGDEVLEITRYFIETLADMHVEKDWIQPWFSGTGFHVDIPELYGLTPSNDLPNIMAKTVRKMFDGLADNIYDRGRLIRVGYSFNSKSGLYKTPFAIDEIFNLKYKEIADISKTFMREDYRPEPLPEAEPIWDNQVIKVKTSTAKVVEKTKSNLNSHVTCVQKMWNNGESKGTRHHTLLRMTSAWKRMGIPESAVLLIAKNWATSLPHTEVERIVNDIFKWDHNGYGCQDDIMAKYCDSKCKFYRNKDYGLEIMSAIEMCQDLREYLLKDTSGSNFDLQSIYRIPTSYKFHAGELVTMIGDTKIGKTAFIQNLVTLLPSMKTLYLSLEVGSRLIVRRFLQIALEKTKDDVYDLLRNGTKEEREDAYSKIAHIHVMTVHPEIKNIRTIVAEHSPKILVIDTMDAIRVDYVNDPNAKDIKIINSLKEIATNQDIVIIGINHISKHASTDGRLGVHSAKGNSAIEQKSDKLIGITQFQNTSNARLIESLAARDENSFKLRCRFNTDTFRFIQDG